MQKLTTTLEGLNPTTFQPAQPSTSASVDQQNAMKFRHLTRRGCSPKPAEELGKPFSQERPEAFTAHQEFVARLERYRRREKRARSCSGEA